MFAVTEHIPAERAAGLPMPMDLLVLDHDERRVRRKLLVLVHGDEIMVDFPQTVTLQHGDRLVLADGRNIEVIAGEEKLYEVRGRDAEHLAKLAWHLGNRHLSAQIEPDRLLIRRDPVMRTMLLGLGAQLSEVSEPFQPEYGAYHSHGDHTHALLR